MIKSCTRCNLKQDHCIFTGSTNPLHLLISKLKLAEISKLVQFRDKLSELVGSDQALEMFVNQMPKSLDAKRNC